MVHDVTCSSETESRLVLYCDQQINACSRSDSDPVRQQNRRVLLLCKDTFPAYNLLFLNLSDFLGSRMPTG
jgi:hypothetical protein